MTEKNNSEGGKGKEGKGAREGRGRKLVPPLFR